MSVVLAIVLARVGALLVIEVGTGLNFLALTAFRLFMKVMWLVALHLRVFVLALAVSIITLLIVAVVFRKAGTRNEK